MAWLYYSSWTAHSLHRAPTLAKLGLHSTTSRERGRENIARVRGGDGWGMWGGSSPYHSSMRLTTSSPALIRLPLLVGLFGSLSVSSFHLVSCRDHAYQPSPSRSRTGLSVCGMRRTRRRPGPMWTIANERSTVDGGRRKVRDQLKIVVPRSKICKSVVPRRTQATNP